MRNSRNNVVIHLNQSLGDLGILLKAFEDNSPLVGAAELKDAVHGLGFRLLKFLAMIVSEIDFMSLIIILITSVA
jgi:hypothetical protein